MPRRPSKCQVPGCDNSLAQERAYYQRYRICVRHTRTPEIEMDGLCQRWCQQCGRFQPLQDFDGKYRTCRARLARHNERRAARQNKGSADGYGRTSSGGYDEEFEDERSRTPDPPPATNKHDIQAQMAELLQSPAVQQLAAAGQLQTATTHTAAARSPVGVSRQRDLAPTPFVAHKLAYHGSDAGVASVDAAESDPHGRGGSSSSNTPAHSNMVLHMNGMAFAPNYPHAYGASASPRMNWPQLPAQPHPIELYPAVPQPGALSVPPPRMWPMTTGELQPAGPGMALSMAPQAQPVLQPTNNTTASSNSEQQFRAMAAHFLGDGATPCPQDSNGESSEVMRNAGPTLSPTTRAPGSPDDGWRTPGSQPPAHVFSPAHSPGASHWTPHGQQQPARMHPGAYELPVSRGGPCLRVEARAHSGSMPSGAGPMYAMRMPPPGAPSFDPTSLQQLRSGSAPQLAPPGWERPGMLSLSHRHGSMPHDGQLVPGPTGGYGWLPGGGAPGMHPPPMRTQPYSAPVAVEGWYGAPTAPPAGAWHPTDMEPSFPLHPAHPPAPRMDPAEEDVFLVPNSTTLAAHPLPSGFIPHDTPEDASSLHAAYPPVQPVYDVLKAEGSGATDGDIKVGVTPPATAFSGLAQTRVIHLREMLGTEGLTPGGTSTGVWGPGDHTPLLETETEALAVGSW